MPIAFLVLCLSATFDSGWYWQTREQAFTFYAQLGEAMGCARDSGDGTQIACLRALPLETFYKVSQTQTNTLTQRLQQEISDSRMQASQGDPQGRKTEELSKLGQFKAQQETQLQPSAEKFKSQGLESELSSAQTQITGLQAQIDQLE